MDISPIFGRDFGSHPREKSAYEHMEQEAERVQRMAEGYFVKGYNPATDSVAWCYGTTQVPETPDLVDWLGLRREDRAIECARMLSFLRWTWSKDGRRAA